MFSLFLCGFPPCAPVSNSCTKNTGSVDWRQPAGVNVRVIGCLSVRVSSVIDWHPAEEASTTYKPQASSICGLQKWQCFFTI